MKDDCSARKIKDPNKSLANHYPHLIKELRFNTFIKKNKKHDAYNQRAQVYNHSSSQGCPNV